MTETPPPPFPFPSPFPQASQMFCFNTLTNLAEVNLLAYLHGVLLEMQQLVITMNVRVPSNSGMDTWYATFGFEEALGGRIDVEPLVALIEHMYTMIETIEKINEHASPRTTKKLSQLLDVSNAKRALLILLADLVVEKGGVVLSSNLY